MHSTDLKGGEVVIGYGITHKNKQNTTKMETF
jgi:hypothetical protein